MQEQPGRLKKKIYDIIIHHVIILLKSLRDAATFVAHAATYEVKT